MQSNLQRPDTLLAPSSDSCLPRYPSKLPSLRMLGPQRNSDSDDDDIQNLFTPKKKQRASLPTLRTPLHRLLDNTGLTPSYASGRSVRTAESSYMDNS